ncbi:TIGR03773 family transporter-associated surface protein [Cellulosimicrobium sp. PMB13]|uniref:TIGR03773 family transporter-associated surface protein n=1 Tax=Cellulosimicrobium sp. PMB13 TaxID=3120158 RepID=UPI003F4BA3A4
MSLTTRSRPLVAALGVLALLASFVVPVLGGTLATASAAPADREHVLTHGHVDGFETTYDAATGTVVLSVKDDTRIYEPGSAYRAPETTTFAYEDARLVQTLPPATGGWAFLGAYGGTDAWIASQTGSDQTYAPWVGWSTERLLGSLAGTGITPASGQPVSLDVRVDGPGDVFAFQNGSFGAPINRYVDTTTSAGGTIPVSANAHVHTNWIYTAEGDYTFVVTPSLATTAHGTITGGAATYHVRIGERAPEPVTTSVSVAADAAEHVEGSTATFTATQEPATELSTYRWEVAVAGSEEFVAVDGATGPTYERQVALADDGARVRAVLLDGDRAAGTSEPVALAVVAAPPTHTVTLAPLEAEYATGSTIYLEATLEPAVEGATYRWESHQPGATTFSPVLPTVFTEATLSLLATEEVEGHAWRVVALDPSGAELATSEPVVVPEVREMPWEAPVRDETPVVLSRGHIDLFNLYLDAGRLTLAVVDGSGEYSPRAVDRAPSAVTVAVDPVLSALPVPDTGYDFLGEPGDEVYVLPSSQTDGLPWPGWTTERLEKSLPEGVTASDLRYEIEADGPGSVSAWAGGLDGSPRIHFDSGDDEPDVVPVRVGAHVHTSWGFTEQGTYTLRVTAKGSLSDGTELVSDTETYTFEVGEEQPAPEPEPEPDPGASEPNREFVLSRGHVDGFEVTYDDASGAPVLSVKDDTRIYGPGSEYRSPADVTIAYEDERALQRLPAAEGAWSFLGEHGGQDAWIGSQTGAEQELLPWVGWSTERLLPSLEGSGITLATGSPVELDVSIEGPGDVFTFQNDSFGNPVNRYVDTTASSGGTIPVTANAHVHTNWVFTAPGDYHLTVTPSLRSADGRTIAGEAADYHVRVGPYAPSWTPMTDDQLTDANRGGLTLDKASYAAGDPAVASSPSFADGQEVVAYAYSEPTSAGTATAQGGAVRVAIPTSLDSGAHKLAVYDAASGDLVGWAPFAATAAVVPGPDDGSGDGSGGDADGDGAGGAGGAGGGGGSGTGGAGSTTPEPCLPTPVTNEVKTQALAGVTDGHFDFGSRVEDNDLVATVKDARKQPPTWIEPGAVTFRLGDAAKDEVPAGGEFSFLGEPGSPIWSIGQVQESGVPWLGWNTQHPTLVEAAAGPVTYTLESVDGPGELGVYATGNFGGVGTKYFGTLDGFPRSTAVPLNQHVHGNWAFTEQGVYKVTFTLSVPLTSGGTVSDTATLTFSVGDSSGITTKTTYVGKTASGESCELSADQKAALASTGADPASALALGVLLLGAGGVLLGVARRRRGTSPTA